MARRRNHTPRRHQVNRHPAGNANPTHWVDLRSLSTQDGSIGANQHLPVAPEDFERLTEFQICIFREMNIRLQEARFLRTEPNLNNPRDCNHPEIDSQAPRVVTRARRSSRSRRNKKSHVSILPHRAENREYRGDESCSICLCPLGESPHELIFCKAKCGQVYHHECINQWLASKRDPHCPMCRFAWIRHTAVPGRAKAPNFADRRDDRRYERVLERRQGHKADQKGIPIEIETSPEGEATHSQEELLRSIGIGDDCTDSTDSQDIVITALEARRACSNGPHSEENRPPRRQGLSDDCVSSNPSSFAVDPSSLLRSSPQRDVALITLTLKLSEMGFEIEPVRAERALASSEMDVTTALNVLIDELMNG